MFRDYITAFMEFNSKLRTIPKIDREYVISVYGDTVETYYPHEVKQFLARGANGLEANRLLIEWQWYKCKRPYFNVYPYIESKLMQVSEEISLSELALPFPVLEIRTSTEHVLVGEINVSRKFLHATHQRYDSGVYREAMFPMEGTLSDAMRYRAVMMDTTWQANGQSDAQRDQALFAEMAPRLLKLLTGVLALARDKSLVTPVIMARHRRDEMTEEEMARYAEAAIKNTNRIGFDVGREMEHRKLTEHYRNGHFARFHVKAGHPMYPPGHSGVSAIVKWRSGCIVNKGAVPTIPTGFHDNEEEVVSVR